MASFVKVFNYTKNCELSKSDKPDGGYARFYTDSQIGLMIDSTDLLKRIENERHLSYTIDKHDFLVFDFDGVNIDKSNHLELWNKLIELSSNLGYINGIYLSPSFQEKCDGNYFGFRIVVKIDNISNEDYSEDYLKVLDKVNNELIKPIFNDKELDKSCKDKSRMFFGTINKDKANNLGYSLWINEKSSKVDIKLLSVSKPSKVKSLVKRGNNTDLGEFIHDYVVEKGREYCDITQLVEEIQNKFNYHFIQSSEHGAWYEFSKSTLIYLKKYFWEDVNRENALDWLLNVNSEQASWFYGRGNKKAGYKRLELFLKNATWYDTITGYDYHEFIQNGFQKFIVNKPINIFNEVRQLTGDYLSDTNDFKDLLLSNDDLITITAGTGDGKSEMIRRVIINNTSDEFIIFVLPYLNQINQNVNKLKQFENKNNNLKNPVERDFVYNEKVTSSIEWDGVQALNKNIITTFDKLNKIIRSLVDCYGNGIKIRLFVDEAHNLINAVGYKKQALKEVLDIIDNKKYGWGNVAPEFEVPNFDRNKYHLSNLKVRLITATIPSSFKFLFSMSKFIKLELVNKKIIRNVVFVKTNNQTKTNILLQMNKSKTENLLFHNDDKTENQLIAEELRNAGLSVLNWSANTELFGNDNDVVELVKFKNGGEDFSNYDIIIITSTAKEGVDFDDKKERKIITTSKNPLDIKQLSGRMRESKQSTIMILHNDDDFENDISQEPTFIDIPKYIKGVWDILEGKRQELVSMSRSLLINLKNTNNIDRKIPRWNKDTILGSDNILGDDCWLVQKKVFDYFIKELTKSMIMEKESEMINSMDVGTLSRFFVFEKVYKATFSKLHHTYFLLQSEGFRVSTIALTESKKIVNNKSKIKLTTLEDFSNLVDGLINGDWETVTNGFFNHQLTRTELFKKESINKIVEFLRKQNGVDKKVIEKVINEFSFREFTIDEITKKVELIKLVFSKKYPVENINNKIKIVVDSFRNQTPRQLLLEEYKLSQGVTDLTISFKNGFNEFREWLIKDSGIEGMPLSNITTVNSNKKFVEVMESSFIIKDKKEVRNKKGGEDIREIVFII